MDYGLYLATVVDATTNDHRLGIKITPQMDSIDSSQCLRWPSFFKDEMTLAAVGDLVWVICNNDFSLGYVLGVASLNTYRGESFEEYSIPKDLKDKISENLQQIQLGAFTIANAKVEFWNETSIHFVERETGGKIIAFNNGTLYIFRPNEFIVKIGNDDKNIIKLTKDGFSVFSAAGIKLGSDLVTLGNNPLGNVLVNTGNESSTAYTSKSVQA